MPIPEYEVLVIVLSCTIAFLLFFYALRTKDNTVAALTQQRVLGGVVLGGIPTITAYLLGDPQHIALRLPSLETLSWALTLWSLAMVFPGLAARHPAFSEHYPEARESTWTRELHLQNAAGWMLYLFGYELLFRGYLLHGLAHRIGAMPAMGVSTGLYVMAHLHKNAGETFGCIPFGLAAAGLSLSGGSFLPLWLVHIGIVLGSEALARSKRS